MHLIQRLLTGLIFSWLAFLNCGCERPPEIKKAQIGDIELSYYLRGTGEPLIMIMGYRGTMSVWDPALLEILEKKFQLILFDNRGVGLSNDSVEDNTTISQMAEDTANLIKSLGFEKAHVLGWSMGSRIAMEVALKHSEVVDTLILCSPNPGGKHQAPRKTNAYLELATPQLSVDKALSLIFPETAEGRAAALAYLARLAKSITFRTIPNDIEVNPQTVQRQTRALKLWNENGGIYDQLQKIKVPTLVTGGLADVLDPPENVTIVAQQIPFAWTAYFAGAGHNFLSQDYKQFGELVILFTEASR